MSTAPEVKRGGLRLLRPEPTTFWIRHAPGRWPCGDSCWTDLASGSLGRPDPSGGTGAWPPDGLDDTTYVPPGATAATSGAGRLWQVARAGDRGRAPEGAWIVVDPLDGLLRDEAAILEDLDGSESVVWPLVAGISDEPRIWNPWLELAARRGVRHVQPVALQMSPRDRRWIAGVAGEASWGRLFHGPPASERDFSRHAAALGMRPFLPRPRGQGSERVERNRVLAGRLALAAELWLRCGRPEADGQALFRAARWVEDADQDLGAVAAEGNLGVVPAFDRRSREIVREAAETDAPPPILAELETEYLGTSP